MQKFKRIILCFLVLMALLCAVPQVLTVSAAAKNTTKTSISKTVSAAKGFKVTWKKKSGVSGYQIQYSTSSKFTKSTTKTKTVGADKTSVTISGLKGCKVTYYVRIRTIKVFDGENIYSAWSSAKKVTTLKHSYAAATCTKAKTCKYCGKTSGKSLGHKWSKATCTKAKTCSRCKATSGKALGHKWSSATCTKAKTCSRCKKTTGKALGHSYAAATCTKAKTCTRCKKKTGKALGHKYAAATCTKAKTCTRCQKTTGKALGHKYAAATCTKAKTCSRCKATSGKALGHKWTGGSCTKASVCSRCKKTNKTLGHSYAAATCTMPKTCTRCRATTGKALGHNYTAKKCYDPLICSRCGADSGVIKDHTYIPATCTKPETCSVCHYTRFPALGHQYGPATCTQPSTCSRCSVTTGTALGHFWNDATCTRAKTCSRCLKTEGAALGHDYQPATCTQPETCSRCSATTGTTIAHSWKAATCTAPKTCAVCSKTEGSKLPHSIAFQKTVAPTCGAQGYDLHKCADCDYTEKKNYTPATGKHITYAISNTSSCTKDGIKTYKCQNCAYTEEEKVVATGSHMMQTMTVADAAPKCADMGNWGLMKYSRMTDVNINFCIQCGYVRYESARSVYTAAQETSIMLELVQPVRREFMYNNALEAGDTEEEAQWWVDTYKFVADSIVINHAKRRAKEIVSDYSHNGKPGDHRENINMGAQNIQTDAENWINSSGHRDNIEHWGYPYFGYARHVVGNSHTETIVIYSVMLMGYHRR